MVPELLIVLMGLPRSGKSTWAREESKRLNAPIINPDSIRLALYGQAYIWSMEPYVWAITTTMVQSLFSAGHETVIIDSTNINRKSRDKWQDFGPAFHYISTPTDICLKRAKDGGRDDLLEVIERMAEQFEPLMEEEGIYNADSN